MIVVRCPLCDAVSERHGRGHYVCPVCDAPPVAGPTFGCPRCHRLAPTAERVTVGVADPVVMCCACAGITATRAGGDGISVLDRAG